MADDRIIKGCFFYAKEANLEEIINEVNNSEYINDSILSIKDIICDNNSISINFNGSCSSISYEATKDILDILSKIAINGSLEATSIFYHGPYKSPTYLKDIYLPGGKMDEEWGDFRLSDFELFTDAIKNKNFNAVKEYARAYDFDLKEALSLTKDAEMINYIKKLLDHENLDKLRVACLSNKKASIKLAKALIEKGADINASYNHLNETPLLAACRCSCNTEMIKYLLERGADPNHIDNYGKNSFFNIITCEINEVKKKEMIQLLFHYGARYTYQWKELTINIDRYKHAISKKFYNWFLSEVVN